MAEIRVFVCDDHEILRKGLRSLFDTVADLLWTGEAGDGESALTLIAESKPDVILMDLLMPGLSEMELIRKVRAASSKSKILVLTSAMEEDMVIGSLEAGADGYLLKTCSPEMLIQAIHDVDAGIMPLPVHISKNISAILKNRQNGKLLTRREIEVLNLIGQGQSNRMIAHALNLSETTVVTHIAHIMTKLGLDNRTQAALYASRRGLV